MKNLQKLILSGALLALIPMTSFADEDRCHDNEHGSSYLEDRFFMEKFKDANYEFEGDVEKRPKDNLSGTWIISGIKVIVDDNTFVSHSEHKIKVGDEVEVLAKRENGKITALDIQQDD